MAVDLNNVNYILLKADGSVLTQKMEYYIQQGSIGDKIFFGSAAAQNTDIGIAVCTLPNGEQTTLQGTWDTCTYEGNVIGGFVFTLGSTETNYNGGLRMALAIYRNNVRLVNYPLYAVINETGLMSDTNTGVTVEEINSYLRYIQGFSRVEDSILVVDNIQTIVDWSAFSDGQVFFDKETNLYYEKISTSPYYSEYEQGLLASERTILRFTGWNEEVILSELYNLANTRLTIFQIEGIEYLIKMNNDHSLIAYDFANKCWYEYSGLSYDEWSDVLQDSNKQIIATIEDLENFGNLFTYKGVASVSEINALTNIGNGWSYNLTDSGTLTLGNLQVEQGDNVAFNGTIWTKLSSETVLGNYYTKQEGQEFENGVNNQIDAIENQVQQVASGSPKGVYATLSDLQAAYPTGAEGIYVVSANGHWYYWNGTAWTDGGVYQSAVGVVPETRKVGIADLQDDITNNELVESVTDYDFRSPSELTSAFLKEGTNQFNEEEQTSETISPHYYVDGAPYSSAQFDSSYNCTALFRIKPNTTYYIKVFNSSYSKPWGGAGQGIFFYDKNGNYISQTSNATFTTPVNAVSARFNYYIGGGNNLGVIKANCVLVYGSTEPTEYSHYERKTAMEIINNADDSLDANSQNLIKNKPVAEQLLIVSPNVFDQSLQTPDTISPHYYVNGVPYSETTYDSSWNCTAEFEIRPSTTYYIKVFNSSYSKPWGEASHGIFFYDAAHNYISGSSNNSFTTPSNAKYARFNYYLDGNNLTKIKTSCMLVVESTEPETYEPYYNTTLKSLVLGLEANASGLMYVSWNKTNSLLKVTYNFDKTRDLMVEMTKKGPNSIFDFSKMYLILNDSIKPSNIGVGYNFLTNGTDFFGPWIVYAKNNVDGDNPDSYNFTGGNHGYNNTGSIVPENTATGRTASVDVRINGKLLDEFDGYCNYIDIYWVNRVQGFNTTKANGTGREILEERYHMHFDGNEWKVIGMPIALEDVGVYKYYGLQMTYSGTLNATNYIEYYGDDVDISSASNVASHSASKNCLGIIKYDFTNNFKLNMSIDNTKGLGRGTYNEKTYSMFWESYGKGYVSLVNSNQSLELNENYYLYFEGSYKFEPIINN